MIRIKPNKCGYTEYTCTGIPNLEDNGHMFDTSVELVATIQAEFKKLPTRIKGTVYVANTIDMGWVEGGPHPEVPEMTCRYDTDPWSTSDQVSERSDYIDVEVNGTTYQYHIYGGTSGWVDLFNSCPDPVVLAGETYGYCYTTSVFLEKEGDGLTPVEFGHIATVGNIPNFATIDGSTEFIMGPGLLEPMLETDFEPIEIDTIPAWEAGDDSFIFTTSVIGAWKGAIDSRINNIYARLNNIPTVGTDQQLRDLKRGEYEDSECSNFQITLTSGSAMKTNSEEEDGQHEDSGAELPTVPIPGTDPEQRRPIRVNDDYDGGKVVKIWKEEDTWHWIVETDANLYSISDGTILVDGFTCTVDGLTSLVAPFYAWVEIAGSSYTINGSTVAPVEGGTALVDGYVTADGGTVANLTSAVVEGTTTWTWDQYYDHTVRVTGAIQVLYGQNEDPTPGKNAGIGGVRIVSGGSSPDDFVLYKIYHEDCVTSMSLGTIAAQVNHNYPPSTPEHPAPEHDPGIVYPYDNIVRGETVGVTAEGSTVPATSGWGGSAYVPTVNAVWDFVHATATETDARALAVGGTMAVVHPTSGPDYVVLEDIAVEIPPVEGSTESTYEYIKHMPGTFDVSENIVTVSGETGKLTAPDCIPTAQAVVDYVGDMSGATTSTMGIIGYTNSQETLWPIPGSTVAPSDGYVQNVLNIYVAGTHGVSGYAVPTVDAVYNFIHNIAVEGMTFSSALVTGGTLAEITTTAEDVTTVTGYTATGEPGTCYMATVIPVGSTVSIGLDNCAPTVQAVIDYVGAVYVDAVAGTLIKGSTTEEWAVGQSYTDPVRGTVEVSSQIVVGATPGLSLQTVPSVKSVYDFVHNSSVDDAYKALATGGTVGNAYPSDTWKLHSVPGSTPTCYTFYRNRYSVVQVEPGQPMHAVATVGNATPGTLYVIDTIVNNGASNVDVKILTAADPETTVPSVTAVYDFVHNMWALAVPGTPGETAEGSLTVKIIKHGIPGTVFTVDTVDTQYLDKGISGYYYDEVPTVRAVIAYVEGRPCKGSTVGLIALSAGTESLASVQGTTAAAGIVQPVKNIVIGGQTPNAISPTAVPTVQAVFDFVHGNTITGYTVADAKATPGVMGSTAAQSVYGTTVTGATPGTYNVVQNIITIQNGTVSTLGGTTAQHYVPEAQAVVDWTTAFVAGYIATGGTISIDDTDGEKWVDASTVFTGIVTVSDNVKVAADKDDRNLSPYAVPTVEAVYLYVEKRVPGDAQEGYIKVASGKESLDFITGYTEAYAGLVQPVVNINAGTESPNAVSPTAVPTVQAVIDYIHGTSVSGYTTADSRATATITELVSGSTTTVQLKTGATRGTFFVTSDMKAITDTVTVYNDPQAVPTAMAVGTYVKGYVAGYTSVAGKITVTGSTAENLVAAVSGTTARAGMVQYVRNILVGGTHSVSTYAVPTVEAVHAYIHGETITGMSFSSSQAGIGTIEESTKSGDVVTGVTASGCTLGTFNVVSNILGATNTTTGALSSVTDVVPTAHAVVTYIKSLNLDPAGMAVSGNLDDSTGDWVNGSTVSAGIYYVATNVVGGTADSDAYSSVPTVHAVHSFVSGYTGTIGGFTVTSNDDEDWITDYEAAPGIISVVDTIDAAEDEDNRSLSISTVPTVAAVKDYVDAVGGGMLFPNIEALGNVSGSPGPGQGVTFLVPVKKGWTIGVDYGGGVSVCAVYAPSDGTTTTPSDCSSDFPVPDDGYARVSVIDSGTTDGCVRFMKGNYRLPLYKSGNMRATGSSVITVSEGAENVTGSPGRCYISNGVNFGGDKAYSKITAPSVEAVYDFIHGTTASGVQMLSALADIAGSTITGTTALALVSTAKPGTVYVTDDFTLLGGTVTTYNDPQAVPTVLAVYNYINGLNLGPAVPGTLEATASSEAWDDEDTAIRGTVLVSKNVTVSTTGNTISTVAVPTVDAVNTFVSGYTASPGTINVPSSGDETWSTASVAGIVKVSNNVAAAGTQANRKVSETAVPTVYAVKTYVDNHTDSYTGDFHLIGGSTIAVGTAYYPGGSKSTVQTAISSISGYASAKIIWLKIYRTSASATINAAFTTSYTRDIYTQCVPIVGRGSTSGNWEQWQRGPVIIEGRWE